MARTKQSVPIRYIPPPISFRSLLEMASQYGENRRYFRMVVWTPLLKAYSAYHHVLRQTEWIIQRSLHIFCLAKVGYHIGQWKLTDKLNTAQTCILIVNHKRLPSFEHGVAIYFWPSKDAAFQSRIRQLWNHIHQKLRVWQYGTLKYAADVKTIYGIE